MVIGRYRIHFWCYQDRVLLYAPGPGSWLHVGVTVGTWKGTTWENPTTLYSVARIFRSVRVFSSPTSYQPTSESNHDVHRWLLGGGFALFLQGLLCRSRQVEKKKLKKITSYIPKQANHAIRTLLPQFLPQTVPYRGAVRK